MEMVKTGLLLTILIIFAGCCGIGQQAQYTCSNGSIVSNPSECETGLAGGGAAQTPFQQQTGCAYNNPVCDSDHNCVNNECIEKIICGKFGCQEGESSSNCCNDCGCATGESCEDNHCVALKPNMVLSDSQSDSYSITIYLSKPTINVGKITVYNNGNDDANNVIVVLSSANGYFEQKTINLGHISQGSYDVADYSLEFTQRGLELTNEENNLVVNAEISYENSANQQFSTSDSFGIMVYGKNNVIGPYETRVLNFAPWVTPDQNVVREFAAKATSGIATYQSDEQKDLAARWLFETMRAYGIQYVNERGEVGDYVQFPMETLKRKNGDCEDQAILYASLIEAIGMKSAVVRIPGHVFSGYYTSEGFVPVDTTSPNFDSARTTGYTEYQENTAAGTIQILVPEVGWADLPEVIHSNEPDIPMMDIKKQITGPCEQKFDLTRGFYYSGTVRFQNNGNAPGIGCASMVTYTEHGVRDRDYECWTILAGETTDKELINDFEILEGGTCVLG